MPTFLTAVFTMLFFSFAARATDVVVWERNYNNPFFKQTLLNISQLTESDFESINFVPSKRMEQGRAFAELLKGNIDIFIAAADAKREKLAKPIYVPIDRGLLGFRVCLVNKSATGFTGINSPEDFVNRQLTIGLGSHWPDRQIYESNGFSVVTSPVLDSLFSMLEKNRFDCFSRSVNEVSEELKNYNGNQIKADDNIVFIYPNADFIFVNPKNPRLHRRLSYGMGRALENKSFYQIFDTFFNSQLKEQGIYKRRLLILQNEQISAKALSAINRFGIASFASKPIESDNKE